MIELALNNPTINVGHMEYNIMRELNVNEIEQVNGGVYQYVVGWAFGHTLDAIIRNWRGSISFRDFTDTRLSP